MARKILLADDSVTAQNMGRKILADAGYEVITVNNGSAALKKIGEQRPDLIVLDVYMPGYSGLEVCQRLKEAGETSRIPILLTVGKLEPFKPEEAKRVRADGYIVKPFEASELLSALSKLEDKVVPRSESSKPGRFARATAAIEEGRYDKSMAVEEDSGWKNRISFPSKKKEKPAEEEIDTGEIYNPVNKDLRTVVEHKVQEPAVPESTAAVPVEEAHVNVTALAPEGLPKDVTPEEIAALAAAAAQIKGKIGDESLPSASAEANVSAAAESPDTPKTDAAELKAEENRAPDPVPMPEAVAAVPEATFAEQQAKEPIEEKKSAPVVSTQADAMAAIMGLETQVMAVFSPENGNGLWAHGKTENTEEPMTMAAAASAQTMASPSRWSAVAVALAPEEASISLEQEMQRAYANLAAAESEHTAAAAATTEALPVHAEAEASAKPAAGSAALEAPAEEPEAVALPTPASDVAQPLSAVSEAATEAMSAASKELEVVAQKYEAEQAAESPETSAYTSGAAEAVEPSPPAVAELAKTSDEKVEENAEANAVQASPDPSPKAVAEPAAESISSLPTEVASEGSVAPTASSGELERSIEAAEIPQTTVPEEIAEETSQSGSVSTEEVPVSNVSSSGGTDDMAKRESETAAAWASWRKIRETGDSKPGSDSNPEEVPQDKAAMAVAAGAETKPEEVAALESDPEIASLVDSVLADMRPKIVEEIARKLGKKK